MYLKEKKLLPHKFLQFSGIFRTVSTFYSFISFSFFSFAVCILETMIDDVADQKADDGWWCIFFLCQKFAELSPRENV